MCIYSRPTVCAYVPNFVWIGLFCRPLAAKNPNFAIFWTSAFSGVANWHQSEKVRHGCTTINLQLSNCIKIVSVLQPHVQKRDGQTDKKTQRFWPPRRRVKPEPHQAWHGDKRTSSTFLHLQNFSGYDTVLLLGGVQNLGGTRPSELKTPLTQ